MSKINFVVEGHIARIILNRPEKLNALDPNMLTDIGKALEQIDHNKDIRVVLLQASGEKAFSVGADIIAWTTLEPIDMWRRWIPDGHRLFDQIATLRQPIIAVLNGHVLGGGLELALTADIRIASDTAYFGFPETKIATIPGWGGTHRLPELIGKGRAKQMIFSGQSINADIAERWGLVNEIHPRDQLYQRADELAAQIASNAPLAVQFAKQAIDNGSNTSTVILEAFAGALSATTEDAQDGLASFKEKRDPKYFGK
jgi:enoyl-CoA hydratase